MIKNIIENEEYEIKVENIENHRIKSVIVKIKGVEKDEEREEA